MAPEEQHLWLTTNLHEPLPTNTHLKHTFVLNVWIAFLVLIP